MAEVTLKAIKRGDGFRRACVYKTGPDSGSLVPTSLDGITITGEVRDSVGTKLCDLTITKAADQEASPGVFVIEANPNPPDPEWPIDLVAFDLEFTSGGIPRSSWTIRVPVIADETRGDGD